MSLPNLPIISTKYINSTSVSTLNSSRNFHFICILKKSEPVRGHLPDLLPIRELYAPPIITLPHQKLPKYANEYNIYPSLP